MIKHVLINRYYAIFAIVTIVVIAPLRAMAIKVEPIKYYEPKIMISQSFVRENGCLPRTDFSDEAELMRGIRVTKGELDLIKAQIHQHLKIPVGFEGYTEKLDLSLGFKKDGSVSKTTYNPEENGQNKSYKILVNSFSQAIEDMEKLSFFPCSQYEVWKHVNISFDANDWSLNKPIFYKHSSQKSVMFSNNVSTFLSQKPDSSKLLTHNEKDSIMRQFENNWNLATNSSPEARDIIVTLKVTLNHSGYIASIKYDRERYLADEAFKAAIDSAIRAVKKTKRIEGLPMDKFERWKEIELVFNPKNVLRN